VAQIGRSIAFELGLDENLTEAIALGHDLGHGPFGHAGERVLNELMDGHGGWDANQHSLEVVDEIEAPYPDFRGLNLTWATREGIALHETLYDVPTDSPEFQRYPQPGPEAQAVSQADECAFLAHDIEDAVNAGLISLQALLSDGPRLWSDALTFAEEVCSRKQRPDLEFDRPRVVLRRATSHVIGVLIKDVVSSAREQLAAGGIVSSEKVRVHRQSLIRPSPELRERRSAVSEYMRERVYESPPIVRQTARGQMVLRRLFGAFVENPQLLPLSTRQKLSDPAADTYQVVARFLAGATDRFALDMYAELFEPGGRTFGGRPD
jgi:dGTPase